MRSCLYSFIYIVEMRASVLTVKMNLPDDLEESDYSVRVRQGVSVHIQTKSFLQRGNCVSKASFSFNIVSW